MFLGENMETYITFLVSIKKEINKTNKNREKITINQILIVKIYR